MATERKLRRDTTVDLALTTPADAELGYDETRKGLIVGDGVTAGGNPTPSGKELQNQSMVAALASGTDTLTLTLSPAPAAYATYQKFTFETPNANTGSVTLNVNTLGAKTIKKNGGADNLAADDLVAGGVYEVVYDGTVMQLVGGAAGAGGLVFIGSVTLTTDATADFTSLDFTTYAYYQLKINVIVSTALDLWCQFFQSATIVEAASDYRWRYDGLLAGFSNGDAKIIIAKSIEKGAANYNEGVTGILNVFPREVSGAKWQGSVATGQFQHHTITSGNVVQTLSSGMLIKNNSQIDGIRIKASTGTMVAGLIELWGVKKS